MAGGKTPSLQDGGDGSQRGLLSRIFHSKAMHYAGLFIWPFSVRPVLRALWAQRYVVPVIVAQQIIHAATTSLFPTGEEFLQRQGFDPQIAAQLSDLQIRVRERNFGGKLHTYTDFPTLFGMLQSKALRAEPVQAYALILSANSIMGRCPVLLQDKNVTARQTIGSLAGLSDKDAEKIEHMPISDRESFFAATFHEFRHCSTENFASDDALQSEFGQKAEADADHYGLSAAAKAFNNPEIVRVYKYARALNMNIEGHDTALYLDTPERDRPALLSSGMSRPTANAFALLDMYMENNKSPKAEGDTGVRSRYYVSVTQHIAQARAMEELLAQDKTLFTPYARRRAELYVEAVQYFFPKAYAEGIPVKAKAVAPPAVAPKPMAAIS